MRWVRGRLYTYRYTFTSRMTPAFKMGSDESHFNVSLTVRDKITIKTVHQPQSVLKRKENRSGIEPKPFCLPA